MGMIPKAINDIFGWIEEMADQSEMTVSCLFVELYQEFLYDLLPSKSIREERVINISKSNNQIKIPGLTQVLIQTVAKTIEALMTG